MVGMLPDVRCVTIGYKIDSTICVSRHLVMLVCRDRNCKVTSRCESQSDAVQVWRSRSSVDTMLTELKNSLFGMVALQFWWDHPTGQTCCLVALFWAYRTGSTRALLAGWLIPESVKIWWLLYVGQCLEHIVAACSSTAA